ncbi:hypothetical protein [Rhodococcus sp. NPDC058521]|uniref:hypothetical protein n=1 Tax=Rhodococcus sp. NPDC058521 TaxID=3346536 RepID=UPI00366192E0
MSGRAVVAQCVRELGAAWDNPIAWQGYSTGGCVDLPNDVWGKIALTEIVVRSWDLARAVGSTVEFPDTVLVAVLDQVASFVGAGMIDGHRNGHTKALEQLEGRLEHNGR